MPTFNVNSVDWDELYRGEADYAPGEPGWNIGEMQPEIAAIHHQGRLKSPILDSGCGVGVVALTLAGYGYDVVGLDLSANAVDKARTAAGRLGLTALFDVADLSVDNGYENHFNTVIDSLVFHSIPQEARDGYIRSTARALKQGGRFFTLVFATEAFPLEATFGPRPFTEKQLRDTLGKHLVVDEVRAARAWINVPRTLPEGFEYRNVTIGSDGRAQLPAWLASTHRE